MNKKNKEEISSANDKTVRYIVRENNLRYHIKKCKMKKDGCIISPTIHPVKEVEEKKQELLNFNLLKKLPNNEGYVLKKDYHTGLLMAYNLCSDRIETELKSYPEIVIDGSDLADTDIKNYFAIKNVVPSDSFFGNMIRKDELKFDKIEKITWNDDFMRRAQSKDFSIVEKFVVETLKKAGIVEEYRRGDDEKQEADIVVEKDSRQIEIVSCLNSANNAFRYKENVQALALAMMIDAVDTEHYGLNQAIHKKFYQKNYTKIFNLELAILLTGSVGTAREMMSLIKKDIIQNGATKNKFSKIYFILIDTVEDKVICVSPENKYIEMLEKFESVPYKKELTIEEAMVDEGYYLLTCSNIFDNKLAGMYLSGLEIKRKIKEIGIWR